MMQAVKRPYAAPAHDATMTSQHHTREHSSWNPAADTRPQRHAAPKRFFVQQQLEDMEDADLDADATAVGALLALQTATHRSQPSRVYRGGSLPTELELALPSRRLSIPTKSPTAEHTGQQDSPALQVAPLVVYPTAPSCPAAALEGAALAAAAAASAAAGAAAAAAAAALQDAAAAVFGAACTKLEAYGASHMEAEQQPGEQHEPERRQKSGTSNSCGSEKDTFIGAASQDLDVLEDMEVTVVSETEKGCQVWFPPLPEEIERLQKSMGSQQRKRKLPGLPRDSAGGAEEADTGTCSTGNNEDAEQGLRAGAPDNADTTANRGHDSKRQRFIWTNELHERFVAAVQHLGVKTAVPKAILQIMKVEGMTRENVASHLQKFRMALRRMEMQSGGAGGAGAAGAAKGLSQEDMAMLSHTHRILLLDEATNSLKQRQDPAAAACMGQHCHALLAQAF